MSKKGIVQGQFSLPKKKDKKLSKKKLREKEEKKLLKEKKKKIKILKKQCICNHVDKDKNKIRLVPFTEDGVNMYKCKICGAVIYADDEDINMAAIERSRNIIRTVIALIKNKIALPKDKFDDLSKALYQVERLPKYYDYYVSRRKDELRNLNDPDKKKKNKDKKKNKGFRIDY